METLYSLRVDPLTPRARSKTSSETSEHSEESDVRSLTHSEHDLARS